jgi:hypothetical protein
MLMALVQEERWGESGKTLSITKPAESGFTRQIGKVTYIITKHHNLYYNYVPVAYEN